MNAFGDREVKWSNTVAIIRSGFAAVKDNPSAEDWMAVNGKVH